MDELTLRDFRQLLEGRMRNLLNDGCAPFPRPKIEGASDPMDSADMAYQHSDRSVAHTIQYRNQQLVQEIRSAIQRIDDGEFGFCSLCSSSIGRARLEARPTAMLCIRCQKTLENLRRRFSDANRRWATA